MASSHVHPTLPFDSCYEILSRTSLETLEQCKLVSKEWNKITFEHAFTKRLCEQTKAIYGFFVQTKRNNEYISSFVSINDNDNNDPNCKLSLNFIKDHRSSMKIEATTNNGLLLCSTQSTKNIYIPEYFICKPTTKQFVKIPNPKTRNYHPIKFGLKILKSNPLHYKVVRFSEYNERRIIKYKSLYYKLLRCDIFDSKNWSWKKLEDIRLIPYEYSWIDFRRCDVSANGVFHWLMPYDNKIFAFDLIKEEWELFELPQELRNNNIDQDEDFTHRKIIRLVRFEGQLGLTCERQDKYNCLELWIMENYGKKMWNKRWEVSFDCECEASFATFCNSDMAIMKGSYNLIFYNLQDYSFKRVIVDNYIAYEELFPLVSDSKPIDGLNNSTKLSTRRSNSVGNKILGWFNNVCGYLGLHF